MVNFSLEGDPRRGERTMSKEVQFVIDVEGKKTAVILPIEQYEELLEDLHLGRVARESKDDTRRPFKDVVEELRAAGEIDV
jgi:hypothetical protein